MNEAIEALRGAAAQLRANLGVVEGIIAQLEKLEGGASSAPGTEKPKRRLSAAGRAAISRASKKRWAAHRRARRAA